MIIINLHTGVTTNYTKICSENIMAIKVYHLKQNCD